MAFSIQDYLENNSINLGKIEKEVGGSAFKGGHNDLRKTNYEVKIKNDGKLDLYTHKTIITEGKKELNEASEVSFAELKPQQQKQVKEFLKILSGKTNSIFEGIHGYIVDIKVNPSSRAYRFDADDLRKLLALKIRWVESYGSIVSVAF